MTEVRSQDAPFLIRLLLANRDDRTGHLGAGSSAAWDEFPEKFPVEHAAPHARRRPRPVHAARARRRGHRLRRPPTRWRRVGSTVEQILERLAMSVAFGQREGAGLADALTEVLGLEG